MTSAAVPFLYVDTDVPEGWTLAEFRNPGVWARPGGGEVISPQDGRAVGMRRHRVGRRWAHRRAPSSPHARPVRPRQVR